MNKKFLVAAVLALIGDICIECYQHYSVYKLEKRMEEFDERYSGIRATAAIIADFESYRQSLSLCEQLCMGHVETFSKNPNNTECTCRNPF